MEKIIISLIFTSFFEAKKKNVKIKRNEQKKPGHKGFHI